MNFNIFIGYCISYCVIGAIIIVCNNILAVEIFKIQSSIVTDLRISTTITLFVALLKFDESVVKTLLEKTPRMSASTTLVRSKSLLL